MGRDAMLDKVIVYFKNKMLLGKGYYSNGDYRNYINLEEINNAIRLLITQKGVGMAYLVNNGILSIDSKVLNKYQLDIFEGKIVPISLSKSVKNKAHVESETPVSSPKPEESDISESVNFSEIFRELKRLNPTANIGAVSVDDSGVYEIASEIPGDKLVLPKGFEYNDKNGITNKHHTKSGKYITISVSQHVKNDFHDEPDISESVNFSEIFRELKRLNPTANIGAVSVDDSGVYEIVSDIPGDKLVLPKGFEYNDKNGITNKHHTKSGEYITISVNQLSKSHPVVEVNNKEENKEEEKPKKRVKNFKKRMLAWLVAAGLITGTGFVISGGIKEALKNNTSNTNDDSKATVEMDGSSFENSLTEEPTITPQEFPIQDNYANENDYPYLNYGSTITYDSMESQIQDINDICFSFEPNLLENVVISEDSEAIALINRCRTYAISNNSGYAYNEFMNNVVRYVYENGNEFEGYSIKPYNSLSPFAKYIVLVYSQSMLSRVSSYSYQTSMNYYDDNMLSVSFDYEVDSIYRTLMNISSKSR